MMAAWMLYTTGVTLVLVLAAGALEFPARALRVPTRMIWLTTMMVAIGLSIRAATGGTGGARATTSPERAAMVSVHLDASENVTGTPVAIRSSLHGDSGWLVKLRRASFLVSARATDIVRRLPAYSRLDAGALDHWNVPLAIAWGVMSVLALGWFAVSLFRLKRLEQTLSATNLDGRQILLSDHVGPALIGIRNPRIVLPRWVLNLPPSERNVIIAHEQAHGTAFDPAVLHAAMLLVLLQPWNVAMWVLMARLRLAVECDCDGRVLRRTRDTRTYGQLLIAVCERSTVNASLRVAFAERQSNLEQRIRRIAGHPRLFSVRGAASSIAAVFLTCMACAAAAPARHAAGPVMPALQNESDVLVTPVANVDGNTLANLNVKADVNDATIVPNLVPNVVPSAALSIASGNEGIAKTESPISQPGLIPTLSSELDRTQRRATWERCSFFRRAVPTETGDLRFPKTNEVPDSANSRGMFPGGCTVFGNVMIMALDSQHILVSARDTSESAIPATDVFILPVKGGTIPLGSASFSVNGRATLTDSVFYYANPGRPVFAFRFHKGASVSEPGAKIVDVENLIAIHSRFLTWDVLPQLPAAPTCAPDEKHTQRGKRMCFLVNGERVQFPIPE